MKRRVIKQGNNTLTVTLPHTWIAANHIKAKDELQVLEQGRSLLLRSSALPGEKQLSLDLRQMQIPAIWRMLISAYRAGSTELQVQYSEQGRGLYSAFSYNTLQQREMSPLEAIQALVNRLIGMEIIGQQDGRCTIKEVVEPSAKEFHNSVRRIFLIIKEMAEESYETVKGEKREVKAIHIKDTNLDRFEDFCLRILNTHRLLPNHLSHALHSFIFNLELLGDEYKRLAVHITKTKSPTKHVVRMLQLMNTHVQRLYELYYTYTPEAAAVLLDENDTIQQQLDKKSLSFEEYELIHHLKKISRHAISLAELCIDINIGGEYRRFLEE